MTRKSRSSLTHAVLIGHYLHKQTHWEMRRPLTTSLEAEGATSLPLDELALLGVVIILCAIWRRKKSSRLTHCHRVKLYNQTSASKNSKPYMARQKVLMFKKISEDIISCIQSMSGYIFKAEYFNGSRQVNISWFHLLLLLSGDVELNPGPYTGKDADVKETLLTICEKLLTMDDWDAVVSAVGPLTTGWDQLGRKLGMHRDTLDIIARNNKEITGLCLNETIAQWLQLNYITDKYSPPSWRSLAEAVVDLNKSLFFEIASDHKVKDEESKEQPNLNDQAMTSVETVQPKPLLHENTDDKSAKFPCNFIPLYTYPGLQLKENFSKEQSEKYKIKLEQHSQEMIITFNDLMYDFYKYMNSKEVPVNELKTFLRGLGRLNTIYEDEKDQPTISKDLKNALTIDDIMDIIWSYCSFFNFSLIKKIVDKLEQLHGFKPRLEEYKQAFTKYAEHKLVYCCPSGIGLNTETIEAAKIFVKLDDAYKNCQMIHLETLREDLCQIFRIPLEIFPLDGVQPGCVCVVFQVPEYMKKEIFPLSEKQIIALRELNYDKIQIYSVVCSEYSYDIREKQPYAAIEDWDAMISAVGPLTAQRDDLGHKLGMHRDTLAIIARNDKEITGLCLNKTIAKTNLNDQAVISAKTVQPKPLLHENTDDKSVKFPWEFIPALTYPGLQLKDNFSKEQSEKYEIKLEQHSREMIITFNVLMYDFYECMISKKVPVSKLKIFLGGLGQHSTIFKDEANQSTISKDLMKAQTIDDMMLIIQTYCSFFNFRLIETIVDRFEQLHGFKPKLEEYKEAFAKYAEHKLVYCCPSGIGLNTEVAEAAEVVVKLDDAYKDCRLTHLETLREDLCQIFRIPLEIFPLEGVQPGSVCVVFQAPEFMKKEIFPLTEKQILALRELNYDKIQIYSVMCSEYSYDIREKQTYAGSDSGIGTFHSKVYPESDLGSDSGLDASYFVTKTMGLEYIKNMKDKFLQMSDKAIQLSTLSEMHMKAIEGDLESIVEMIENETTDYNPMNRDVRGNTALHYAAGNGHLHVIKYFVEELGFNCTIEGRDGITPLHYAASMGHQHIVEYLLDFQQVEALCHDKYNCTPLHYACREGHIGVVKQLADNIEQYLGEMQECNSSCLNEENLTPLHVAAVRGHLSVIEYLVKDKECDSMCKNIYGNTPLHAAASCGHLDIVKFLIENLNGKPETLNKFGQNALHTAAMSGQLNVVEHLIKKEGYNPSCLDKQNISVLHLAASEGHLSVVKYLILDKACNPMCKDNNGNTALYLAAKCGHLEVLQFLIANMNCTPEILNNDGHNPLHVAAMRGKLNIIQYLIEKEGYSPFLKDTCDRTPLHYAAFSGHLETVKYLTNIYSCQDLNLLHDHAKHLPIHSAASGGSLETIKFLEQFNDLHSLDRNGLSCLHVAAEVGHLEAVRYFIEAHSFYPAIEDYDQVTPLHLASWQGHLQVITYLIFEKDCDPLCRDMSQDTPLHWAASEGQLETVKFFIEVLNLSPFIEGEDEQTVLGYAELYGHDEVVEYIISTLE